MPPEPAVTALHRHQLARLTAEGWRCLVDAPWDDEARACLDVWAARDLPLVVTRQPAQRCDVVALGLPAPSPWRGRRLALTAPREHIAGYGEFPMVGDPALVCGRRRSDREEWDLLGDALAPLRASARVFGSRGWQAISGLPHAHAQSDIDLWIRVADAEQADAVAAVLWQLGPMIAPRLDGELSFPDGRAVAWREWRAWRAGQTRAILCRTLTGAALVDEPFLESQPC